MPRQRLEAGPRQLTSCPKGPRSRRRSGQEKAPAQRLPVRAKQACLSANAMRCFARARTFWICDAGPLAGSMPKIRSTVPRDRARIEHHRSNVWPYTRTVSTHGAACAKQRPSTGTYAPGEAFRSGTWTFAAATRSSTARNCAPGNNLRGRSSTRRANGTHALSSMPSAALVSGVLSPGTAFSSGCADTARSDRSQKRASLTTTSAPGSRTGRKRPSRRTDCGAPVG